MTSKNWIIHDETRDDGLPVELSPFVRRLAGRLVLHVPNNLSDIFIAQILTVHATHIVFDIL
jgi:hypothetical protein